MFKKIIFILSILIGTSSLGLSFEKPPIRKQEKLNVILIVVDALRANHLGCYGYKRDTSPNIDRLAKEGVLFTSTFSQGGATRIAVPSLFTSLYPSVHKVYTIQDKLPNEFITLVEVLKEYNYITAGFSAMPFLKKDYNLNQGFSFYVDKYFYTSNTSKHTQHDSLVTQNVLGWLDNHSKIPFFIYIHYVGAHGPYLAPSPFDRIFWKQDVNEEMKNFVKRFYASPKRHPLLEGMWPDKHMFDYIISQYDGRIAHIDDLIKTLLKELGRLDLSKNTLVILTSDHGEEFLDHGSYFHENSLYDELIHVPLIMRLPGVVPQGKVIPNLVRHIDIMPTILDILDIPYNNPMQGVSLLPLIKGESTPKLEVFSEGHPGGRHLKGIRTERYKFVEVYTFPTNTYSYELYDLEADPKELNNLVKKRPQEAELLKTRLRDYTLSCEKIRKSILGEGFVDKPVILDEESKEQLRSLGYLQ